MNTRNENEFETIGQAACRLLEQLEKRSGETVGWCQQPHLTRSEVVTRVKGNPPSLIGIRIRFMVS